VTDGESKGEGCDEVMGVRCGELGKKWTG